MVDAVVTLTADQCRAIVRAFDQVDCSETGYPPFEELRNALAPVLTSLIWRTDPKPAPNPD